MPIEIRELVIRAHIEEADTAGQSNNASNRHGSISFTEKEAIITACVEQVIKIMEDKKER